ncbi:SCP2 sterol-binding domain-containing protein [Polycladidibacter hongkongensis]|uniref:SCP2 sterol-binding domain-containing protein n=1 Tax=Polycladidibacter hongkongensis TaxID=1647556 RepID=UPI000830F00A|nr:SCP2 sterol-binding domain-containing protein [Pseudovibrio hongkongensis]
MSLETIADSIRPQVEAAAIEGTIKFDCGDDGVLVIDGEQVSTQDKTADCTIGVALEDLEALMAGDLNPTMAFMQGKFKIDGDMGLAMKLQQLI